MDTKPTQHFEKWKECNENIDEAQNVIGSIMLNLGSYFGDDIKIDLELVLVLLKRAERCNYESIDHLFHNR